MYQRSPSRCYTPRRVGTPPQVAFEYYRDFSLNARMKCVLWLDAPGLILDTFDWKWYRNSFFFDRCVKPKLVS